jgi:hypothetical protein
MENASRLEAFKHWLRFGRVGSFHVYYRGLLMYDRQRYMIVDGETYSVPNEEIDALGREAIEAWEAGNVHLFQRKLHDNEYEYIAVKRYSAGPLWQKN